MSKAEVEGRARMEMKQEMEAALLEQEQMAQSLQFLHAALEVTVHTLPSTIHCTLGMTHTRSLYLSMNTTHHCTLGMNNTHPLHNYSSGVVLTIYTTTLLVWC